jgi:peptide/nickel transport system permease protein
MMWLLRRLLWPRWVRSGRVLVGLAAVLGLFAVAVLAPVLAPHDPQAQNLTLILRPVALGGEFPLGTDGLGRCVLSRLLFGARAVLLAAVPAALGALVLGGALGLAAGWWGGWVDRAAGWLAAGWAAFPPAVLALLLVAGGAGVTVAVLLAGWPLFFRVTRAELRAAAGREHVAAARLLGFPPGRVLWREVAPVVVPALLALLSLATAGAMALTAALGFLGLGGAPDGVGWGAMLADGREAVFVTPMALVAPGVALAGALTGFVLLGDGLRRTLGLALPETREAEDGP